MISVLNIVELIPRIYNITSKDHCNAVTWRTSTIYEIRRNDGNMDNRKYTEYIKYYRHAYVKLIYIYIHTSIHQYRW